MKEFASSEESEAFLADAATKIIVAHHDGPIPEYEPFSRPPVYDNHLSYEDNEVLDMIVAAVNAVVRTLVTAHNPNREIEKITIPADVMERICWAVFGRLRLLPFEDSELEETFESFSLPPDIDTNTPEDQPFNRLAHMDWEKLQETYETLEAEIHIQLNRRHTLLRDFFHETENRKKEELSSYIDHVSDTLRETRKDIRHFCHTYHFHDPFESLPEEEDTFQAAIHWNDTYRQNEAKEPFPPSPVEERLFVWCPRDMQTEEMGLFQMHFYTGSEINSMGADEDDVLEQDTRTMYDKMCERKMFIYYHVTRHLLLHRRGRIHLSPERLESLEKEIKILTDEIEVCERKLAHKGRILDDTDTPSEEGKALTHRMSEIESCHMSCLNLLQRSGCQEEGFLDILTRLSEALHTCLSNIAQIASDDDLSDYDKDEIIASFCDETKDQLDIIRHDIMALGDVAPGVIGRVEGIVRHALSELNMKN